jgi:regulator of RNase E activity RraB
LTQVVELVHAHELEKNEKSTAAQKKDGVNVTVASELCDAVMKILVCHDMLTDVAQLKGALVHEKQGQKKHKYVSQFITARLPCLFC